MDARIEAVEGGEIDNALIAGEVVDVVANAETVKIHDDDLVSPHTLNRMPRFHAPCPPLHLQSRELQVNMRMALPSHLHRQITSLILKIHRGIRQCQDWKTAGGTLRILVISLRLIIVILVTIRQVSTNPSSMFNRTSTHGLHLLLGSVLVARVSRSLHSMDMISMVVGSMVILRVMGGKLGMGQMQILVYLRRIAQEIYRETSSISLLLLLILETSRFIASIVRVVNVFCVRCICIPT